MTHEFESHVRLHVEIKKFSWGKIEHLIFLKSSQLKLSQKI